MSGDPILVPADIAQRPGALGFWLKRDGHPWERVDKAAYVSAERAAGFRNTLGQPHEPATSSFGAPGIRGSQYMPPVEELAEGYQAAARAVRSALGSAELETPHRFTEEESAVLWRVALGLITPDQAIEIFRRWPS